MKNLNRLMNRENKWYKIGPIQFARGVPKRTPFYFLILLVSVYLLTLIPPSPFWILAQSKGGWAINYIVFPSVGTWFLQNLKKGGKTPEKYIWTMIQFFLSKKYVNPYRPIEKREVYVFGTPYTFRYYPRKER